MVAFAYRVIGSLWGDGLRYIIVKAKVEVVLVGIQHAADNVSHWPERCRDCPKVSEVYGPGLVRKK